MQQPLDGARLKVIWAEKHLKSLNEEIQRYVDSHPYELPVEFKGDAVITRAAIINPVGAPTLAASLRTVSETSEKAWTILHGTRHQVRRYSPHHREGSEYPVPDRGFLGRGRDEAI